MVRTDYMPNDDWTTLCERGRALRDAASTLTGHAIGAGTTPALDPASVAHVIGTSQLTNATPPDRELPEPLASVVAYLGADLDEDGREFIPTAELAEALTVEPTAFGRQMGELCCRPRPGRVTTEDGTVRQVRGYLTADIRAAVTALQHQGSDPTTVRPEPVATPGVPSHRP
jgi:S-DNA-T family DNA segregation ATPase FtsK/SpoIIIE